MKASIHFDTIQDLASFVANPQDVSYTSSGYQHLGTYSIDVDINGLTTIKQIQDRAINGVVVEHHL